MLSGSQKLLSRVGRQSKADVLGWGENGSSVPGIFEDSARVMQQLRREFCAKVGPAFTANLATEPQGAGAQPPGRSYSAVPEPQSAGRAWHVQESSGKTTAQANRTHSLSRRLGAVWSKPAAAQPPQPQHSRRQQPKKHLNGQPPQQPQQQSSAGLSDRNPPLQQGSTGPPPGQQPQQHSAEVSGKVRLPSKLRPAASREVSKPRFLTQRDDDEEEPQHSAQQPQQRQHSPSHWQGRHAPNGSPRPSRTSGWAPASASRTQPWNRHPDASDRSQQQGRQGQGQGQGQSPHQQQPHHQRPDRGARPHSRAGPQGAGPRYAEPAAPQGPLPWWQKQWLQQQQAAAGDAQQGPRTGQQGQSAAAQQQQQQQPQEPEEVHIPAEVSVLKLASLLGTRVERLESVLKDLGEPPASEQDLVSPDSAELAAMEFGKVAVMARDSSSLDADAVPRPAVVTVMGHVDHGKTTLLDSLRSTSVAAGEAGGITQHIGAFQVQMPGSKSSLTFLDTPGHAAFSSMRARGAAVTDLVVLVVAADDGVMPQTLEAISHAKAAACPVVVAITKCDVPSANPSKVRQQLMARGVELEEVGGNVQVVEVAATQGVGLDLLEECLLLQAELLELKASHSRRGEAVVIEAKMDKGQGPVATVVMKKGKLKVGQVVVVGSEWGKVRSLRGTGGGTVKEVLPGEPAEIAGLKGLPHAGDELLVVADEERAQRMAKSRKSKAEFHRRAAIARLVAASQAKMSEDREEGGSEEPRLMPIIVKADVQGSAEAVRDAICNLSTDKVKVDVVHMGVGPVSQSDVQLAIPLNARIVGFNVKSSGGDVEALAKQHGLEIRCQRVIYHLLEELCEMMVGVAPREEHEVVVGSAEVLQMFQLKGARGKDASMVAGCRVTDGSIKGSLKYKVLRNGEAVHEGQCASLKRHKLDVETVGKGTECGLVLDGFDGFQLGDVVQCVDIELRAPEFKTNAY